MPDMMPGLSCYTANLHAYLGIEWDATALIAASVRLAVRDGVDRLVFSHHAPPLDRLPDGSCLVYAGAEKPADARDALARELDVQSRVLVLVDHARLPWSVTRGGRPAPHWLLLDARCADMWHAVDMFRATLPGGADQREYRGPIDAEALTTAMTVTSQWTPAQRCRNSMAFGTTVAVPEAAYLWLRRAPGGTPCPGGPRDPGSDCAEPWITSDAALQVIADRLTTPDCCLDDHLDDLWAAAGHHCFAYRRRLARTGPGPVRDRLARSMAAWARLPKLLRIAAEASARGRPRSALIRAALDDLRFVEIRLSTSDEAPAREGLR